MLNIQEGTSDLDKIHSSRFTKFASFSSLNNS